MLDKGLPFAVVLEDDAELSPRFRELVLAALTALADDEDEPPWDVIQVDYGSNPSATGDRSQTSGNARSDIWQRSQHVARSRLLRLRRPTAVARWQRGNARGVPGNCC